MKFSTLLSVVAVAALVTGAAPRPESPTVTASTVAFAQDRERVSLGVMRRDGVVLPFAAYDGDWSTPWPGSIRGMELPITLDAIPKKWWGAEQPAAWTLVRGVGRPPVKVTPAAPLAIPIGIEMRLGLRTDFKADEAPPPLFEFPYPKEGLAVAGNVQVEPVAGVSRQAAAVWRELAARLRPLIDAAEQKTINQLRGNAQWTHPVPRQARETVPAELEAWYTSMLEQPGFSVSYIEAVKKYPPGPADDGCGLETFVTGWVHSNMRDPRPRADLTARVTYCDRKGVSYMLPLGRMRLRNRTHWIFQTSGWDREWYSVVESTPGKVRFVVEYYAGGRPPV
jgi:hypothetical protein